MARVPTAKEYGLSTYPSGTRQATKLHNADEIALALFPTMRQNVFYWEDDFGGVLDTTSHWTVSTDTTGTDFAWSAGQNGFIKGTTHTDSGDGTGIRYKNAILSGDKNAGCEFRFSIDTVGTTVRIDMGLTDAITDVKDSIINDIDTPTTTNGAGDCAILAIDTSQTLKTFALVGTNSGAGTTKTTLSPTFSPTASLTTWYVARIQLVGNNAWGFIWDANGVSQGSAYLASALEGGTALFPYFNVTTVTTAAKNAQLDYVKIWQDRG
jgi:hypothetical protein